MTDPYAQFADELAAVRDKSIATLQQASDYRRVKQLASNFHASLQGESQADGLLALTKTIGVWLRSLPLEEQVTCISVVVALLTQEITSDNA